MRGVSWGSCGEPCVQEGQGMDDQSGVDPRGLFERAQDGEKPPSCLKYYGSQTTQSQR